MENKNFDVEQYSEKLPLFKLIRPAKLCAFFFAYVFPTINIGVSLLAYTYKEEWMKTYVDPSPIQKIWFSIVPITGIMRELKKIIPTINTIPILQHLFCYSWRRLEKE